MSEVPMEVVVLGRHLEVPDALKQAAARKMDRVSRYLGGMERAEVCFSNTPVGRLGDPVTCEIKLEGHGHVVRAVGAAGRPAAALDAALDKAELQLSRLKGKLVGRSRPRHGNGKRPAPALGTTVSAGPDRPEVDVDRERLEAAEPAGGDDSLEGIAEP
ncbi:MAG TPA: ribosome-associated translation inhibitor RaiA [Acidimicrobiales bacterium]|nr:ribosome-associated translation inhibitor RaiA [Acidimicrobiales bacterium]